VDRPGRRESKPLGHLGYRICWLNGLPETDSDALHAGGVDCALNVQGLRPGLGNDCERRGCGDHGVTGTGRRFFVMTMGVAV
jgi:hypothetical protein